MKFVVLAGNRSFEQLKSCNPGLEWLQVTTPEELVSQTGADAYFDLRENATVPTAWPHQQPYFINSVTGILGNNSTQFTRINGWNSFLENATWEIAGKIDEQVRSILALLQKKIIATADVPGFISARVVSMIINEAYLAREENVSTETEIDTAMKLGTNYPYGPFEWAGIIGPANIYHLLKTLSSTDKRYTPAGSLAAAATQP